MYKKYDIMIRFYLGWCWRRRLKLFIAILDGLEWNTIVDLSDEFIFEFFESQEYGKIYRIYFSVTCISKRLVYQISGIVEEEVISKKETVGLLFKQLL